MASNTIQNLLGNRDAIRQLMALDSTGKLDEMATSARLNGTIGMTADGQLITPQPKQRSMNNNSGMITEAMAQRHSRMPRQIIESFQQNPGHAESTSVLSSIPQETLQKLSNKPIVESAPIVQQSVGGGIDYSLLRTIINEAVQENVKKYMSAMSRKLINEGIGSGSNDNDLMCMKLGNTFSFIDSKGNIYEAKLKFVKKIDK